jgi:hypothetical protein
VVVVVTVIVVAVIFVLGFPASTFLGRHAVVLVKAIVFVTVKLVIIAAVILVVIVTTIVIAVVVVTMVVIATVIFVVVVAAVVFVLGFPAGALLGRYAVVAVIPIVVVAAAWAIVAGNGSGTSADSGEENGGSEASERSFHGVNYLRVNLLSYQQRRGNYPFANARPETWPPRVLSPLPRSNPDQRQHNADWQT